MSPHTSTGSPSTRSTPRATAVSAVRETGTSSHVGTAETAVAHGFRRSTRRLGFTVIELLVVIVVITILVALLLPAINAVRARATIAQVRVEIGGLETDIAKFKTDFGGVAPPSGITLYETASNWIADVASTTTIRRLWPQFDFTINRDINGDGDTSDTINLNGSECLVFFLGGVTATNVISRNGSPVSGGSTPVNDWTPLGFSKNPRNPFERGAGTRSGPYSEFDPDRFRNSVFVVSDTWMPEYIDTIGSQTRPYVYVSSYDGKGYRLADLTGTTLTNVYLQKDDDLATIGDSTEIPWKQNDVQIISPGFDGEYGLGGFYDPEGTLTTAQVRDRDNITNFSSGEME